MSGIIAYLGTPADVALAAGTAKTVLQIAAPTNLRLTILRLSVFFDGITATNTPVLIEVLRQTSAGTSTAASPASQVVVSETLQATGGYNFTAEPTAGSVIDLWRIHPQSGMELLLPLDQQIQIAGGGRLGIRCTAAQVVNARAKFVYKE